MERLRQYQREDTYRIIREFLHQCCRDEIVTVSYDPVWPHSLQGPYVDGTSSGRFTYLADRLVERLRGVLDTH